MARRYRLVIFLVVLALLAFPAVVLGAPAEQGGASYYVVQPGDTLADIAIRLGVSTSALAKANNIANWDFIYVGQRLLIPGTTPTPAPVPPVATALPESTPQPSLAAPAAGATLAPGAVVKYTVMAGDTLTKLAARYGTTVRAIMAANGLTNPDFIWVGQQLTIGGDANPPPAARAVATPQPPRAAPAAAPETSKGAKWIDINLSEQRLTAFEGQAALLSVLISSGTAAHPTVIGNFAVNTKVRSQTMSGPGYRLPNVPWVMYFYRDYAIHGTYWHSNFGHPMSHGCINVTIADAAWLYTWASIGTPVVTHW